MPTKTEKELQKKWLQKGMKKGRIEGKIEGKIEGIIECKIRIAIKMIKLNVDINTICKATGIGLSDIKKLRPTTNKTLEQSADSIELEDLPKIIEDLPKPWIQKGIEMGVIKVARNLFKENHSLEEIAELTDLSLEDLEIIFAIS